MHKYYYDATRKCDLVCTQFIVKSKTAEAGDFGLLVGDGIEKAKFWFEEVLERSASPPMPT